MAVYRLVLMHQFEHIRRSRSVGNLKLFKLGLGNVGGEFVNEVTYAD